MTFTKMLSEMIEKEKECLASGYDNEVPLPSETVFSVLSDLEEYFYECMEAGENSQDDFFMVCKSAARIRVMLGFPSDLYSKVAGE